MERTNLIACLLVLLGACADEAYSTPAPAVAAPDATTAPRALPAPAAEVAAPAPSEAAEAHAPFLVWGTDRDGLTYSFWIERTATGFASTEATGVVIAADGALYHWVEEEVPLEAKLDCETLETDGSAEATGVAVFLDRVGGGERRDLFSSDPLAALEAADYSEEAALIGSLGPFLFVTRSTYEHHCGAHGGVSYAFHVIDARTGNPVELYGEEELPAVARFAEAARTKLVSETDGEALVFGEDIEQTLFRPVLDASGARMAHQWTMGACYACSDGEWDSYTVSTTLESDALPAVLAPHAEGTADVLRWLTSEVEGITIGGVSRPDPALRAAFETLPAEGC